MRLMISEILENASKLRNRDAKINYLRENDSLFLRRILSACYDVRSVWLLPDDDPHYTPAHSSTNHTMLFSESRKLPYFMDAYPGLKQSRRETMFIEFLESIHPKDAAMMLKIRKKKMPYTGITEAIVREAFPDLLHPLEDKDNTEKTNVKITETPPQLG